MPAANRTRAIGLLMLLTCLNILNFADRFLLQGFAVDIMADLHLSSFQFTLLTGFGFSVFYTAMGLLMGVLADRLHRPRLMAAGLLAWSALTAVTGFAATFAQAAWSRMFIGVGEATLTPAALGLLGDTFERRQRAFAAGFYYLGSPIGIGSAFLIAGTLGASLGWRHCFQMLGLTGILITTLLLILREPRPALAVSSASHVSVRSLRDATLNISAALKTSPPLCWLILGSVLVIFAQGALVLDQPWLVQERGFTREQAQNLSGMFFLIGGTLGALLGGWGSDLLQARIAGGRLYFLAIAYLAGAPACILSRCTDPAGTGFYICLFIGSIMLTIGYGALFASLQELVPDRMRSVITAFLILCMTLFGTSPGNLLTGWLADHFRSVGYADPITHATLIGLMPWLAAIPCFYLAARHLASQQSGTDISCQTENMVNHT